jgi:hypothetical protein
VVFQSKAFIRERQLAIRLHSSLVHVLSALCCYRANHESSPDWRWRSGYQRSPPVSFLTFSKWTSSLCRTSCQWCTSSSLVSALSTAWNGSSTGHSVLLSLLQFALLSLVVAWIEPRLWLQGPWTVVRERVCLSVHCLCHSWTLGCFLAQDAVWLPMQLFCQYLLQSVLSTTGLYSFRIVWR